MENKNLNVSDAVIRVRGLKKDFDQLSVLKGIDVDIRTSGVQGAPWRVELAFSGISRISNEHMTMPIHGDEVIVLKDSDFTVTDGFSSMTVGPAFGVHHFTDGKEDSEAKTPGAATVYMTDYTQFHHVISIRP